MEIAHQELLALATGETVIAFVARAAVFEGDEVSLEPGAALPAEEMKPAYAAWSKHPAPEGNWLGVVEAIHPASALDPDSGSSRHVRAGRPDHGDLAVLRVFGPDGPVLGEAAFAARRSAVDGSISF